MTSAKAMVAVEHISEWSSYSLELIPFEVAQESYRHLSGMVALPHARDAFELPHQDPRRNILCTKNYKCLKISEAGEGNFRVLS